MSAKNMVFPNIESCNPRLCISGRISRIQRIVSEIFRHELKPYGLSNSQLSILFVVAKREAVMQKEICDILYLEKSSLSRNLTRLFSKNYISKLDNGLVQLTQKGKVHLETVIPAWNRAMVTAREKLGNEGEDALQLVLNNLVN